MLDANFSFWHVLVLDGLLELREFFKHLNVANPLRWHCDKLNLLRSLHLFYLLRYLTKTRDNT